MRLSGESREMLLRIHAPGQTLVNNDLFGDGYHFEDFKLLRLCV